MEKPLQQLFEIFFSAQIFVLSFSGLSIPQLIINATQLRNLVDSRYCKREYLYAYKKNQFFCIAATPGVVQKCMNTKIGRWFFFLKDGDSTFEIIYCFYIKNKKWQPK